MASKNQIDKWEREAKTILDNPDYIKDYVRYKQLAKQADQRLVRLEALGHEEHFKGVLEFSYKRAIRDIKSWGGDKRFNTAPPTNITQLEAKLSDIEHFLASDTSSKRKILKIYKQRADTINKRYAKDFGVKFTWQDIANYYEDENERRKDFSFGSKTEVRVLAVIKGINSKKLKNIEDVNDRIDRIAGKDKIAAEEAKKLLKMGYDYETLMGDN